TASGLRPWHAPASRAAPSLPRCRRHGCRCNPPAARAHRQDARSPDPAATRAAPSRTSRRRAPRTFRARLQQSRTSLSWTGDPRPAPPGCSRRLAARGLGDVARLLPTLEAIDHRVDALLVDLGAEVLAIAVDIADAVDHH